MLYNIIMQSKSREKEFDSMEHNKECSDEKEMECEKKIDEHERYSIEVKNNSRRTKSNIIDREWKEIEGKELLRIYCDNCKIIKKYKSVLKLDCDINDERLLSLRKQCLECESVPSEYFNSVYELLKLNLEIRRTSAKLNELKARKVFVGGRNDI